MPKAMYTQEVYLATNSDYAGTDQYVLTNAGVEIPTDITIASLNGVALTITDGKLPDITMDYYKIFGNYGRSREIYMNIYAGDTVIANKKAEQTPLTLIIKTAAGAMEFTNLLVCTDVIQEAADLNRFSVTYYSNVQDEYTYTNNGYYVMTDNINAEGLGFKHKNNTYGDYRRFVGTFDGRGYTISNLDLDQAEVGKTGNTETFGLFGNLLGADILNVGFVNVSAEAGSVLGSQTNYISTGDCNEGHFTHSQYIFPHIDGQAYASTRVENVYIQVSNSVKSMKGALCPGMSGVNFLKNVVIEWNPTEATALSSGFGSFIGSGTFTDAEKPKRENVIVLSSVALNNSLTSCTGVAVFTDRATMESSNTASLEGFGAYWTTASNAPVWNTANWQSNQ